VVATLRQDMGGPEALAELLQTYLEESEVLLANARSTLAQGDAAGLRLAAHALKGSSATVGARAMAQACEALEECGRSGDLAPAAPLLDEVERAWRAAKGAVAPLARPSPT
jgi:two-component system, sensor histidine kinase and response regulator